MFSARTNWKLAQNRLTQALEEVRAAGASILDLTISNPTRVGLEYDSGAILAALASLRALDYDPQPKGLRKAREAVAEYYRSDHGVCDLEIERIILTTSTSEGYSYVFKLLCNAGDELLVPKPSYPLFEFLADLQDVKLVPYPLIYDHGWQMDFPSLEKAVTARTRGVVVVHPNNPTGSYVKAGEQEQLNAFCREHGLALIADEVFLDYELERDARIGNGHVGTAALGRSVERSSTALPLQQSEPQGLKPVFQQQPDRSAESAAPPKCEAGESEPNPRSLRALLGRHSPIQRLGRDDRARKFTATSFVDNRDVLTFTLSGLSKISALPQMKVAWIVTSGPEAEVAEAIARLEVIADTYLSMNAAVQWAVSALLEQRRSIQRQLLGRVRTNLAELDRQLAGQKACQRLEVEGGWYAVLRVPVTRSDEELAIELVREKRVLVHPGHFYDFPGDGYLVVSLITPEAEFAEGVKALLDLIDS
jgi:aspartate/methionine/tyrosine aminotransferase